MQSTANAAKSQTVNILIFTSFVPATTEVQWPLCVDTTTVIIIIKEICKAPTPRLEALTKHKTHEVHRDGMCYKQFNKS